MRLLRLGSILVLLCSLAFYVWATARYYSNLNMDTPVLESDVEELVISASDGREALLQGLHASDATDGDLTDQIMISSISHFLEPGVVKVRYVVFDEQNHSATLERRVRYKDYTAPRFSLEEAPVYRVGESFSLLDEIGATDVLDGDISRKVRLVSSAVSIFSAGTYPVTLEVSNSCGETAQITLWVTYESKESTAIVTLHRYIVYVQQGQSFDPAQWLATVTDRNANALDKDKVELLGNLDTSTPGCYQLVYSYQDGTLSGQAPLTVVVTERQD